MRNRLRSRRRQSGFTLTELIVSVAVVGTVTAAATWLLAQQGRSYQVIDQVTEVQQHVRAIADMIEREARVTGFLVAEGAAFCGQDNTNRPDVIFFTDSDSLMPGGSELGAEIASGFTGTGTNTLQVDNVVLDGVAFYDTDGNSVSDSDFRIGAGVIIVDPTNAARGSSCGVVTGVSPPTGLRVDYTLGGGSIGAGANLVAIPAHYYAINGANELVRDGMVLADGADDLQFALFYDLDNDGVVDANVEDPGSYGGVGYVSDNWDNEFLREIRINVVARTPSQDPNWSQGQFQATENRAPLATTDGFRRRIYTASVRPRNVGQRGGL